MKTKTILPLLLFLISAWSSFSQKVELVVKNDVYQSFVCTTYKVPLYVVYNLSNGGGDCDRRSYHFKHDPECVLATDDDYQYTGFDKGHLANAEDFAYDCPKQKTTFFYTNCIPQTVKLNRGIWKTWEEKIREISHEEPLQITCGGIYAHTTIGSGVYVPTHCYKIVKSQRTGKYLYVLLFTNTAHPTVKEVTMEELKSKLGYKLVIPKV